MGGIVGFATMGLQSALCPGGSNGAGYQLLGSRDCECSCPRSRSGARGMLAAMPAKHLLVSLALAPAARSWLTGAGYYRRDRRTTRLRAARTTC
jgi:hypothetical protein